MPDYYWRLRGVTSSYWFFSKSLHLPKETTMFTLQVKEESDTVSYFSIKRKGGKEEYDLEEDTD